MNKIEKLLSLYMDTYTAYEKSTFDSGQEGVFQRNVLGNMQSFLAANLNQIMKDCNYDGYDRESMLLPNEKLSEKETFAQWQKMAFEPKNNKSGQAFSVKIEKRKNHDDISIKSKSTCKKLESIVDEVIPFIESQGDEAKEQNLEKEQVHEQEKA